MTSRLPAFLVFFTALLTLIVSLPSCGGAPFTPAIQTLNATGYALEESRTALLEQYERAQFTAIEATVSRDDARAELAVVRRRFKPLFDKYNAASDLWQAASKLVRQAVKDHEAGKPTDPSRVMRAVLDAAAAVRALTGQGGAGGGQ